MVVSTGGVSAANVARSTPRRVALAGSAVPASERTHTLGTVAGSSPVSFDLVLTLRNASGARAAVRAVSGSEGRIVITTT